MVGGVYGRAVFDWFGVMIVIFVGLVWFNDGFAYIFGLFDVPPDGT